MTEEEQEEQEDENKRIRPRERARGQKKEKQKNTMRFNPLILFMDDPCIRKQTEMYLDN